MSLLIWLPLTKTLENKGLNNITFSNTGSSTIVINNNGKIGKCYNRSSIKTAGRIISDSTINLNGDISMFCWAKVTECVGDTANGLISNHSHTNNTGFGITIKQISTSDYRISCSTGNGSNRTYNTYYGTSNIKDKWSHLGLTYDNTKKEFKLWVDGICEKTVLYTNSSRNDYIMIFDWSTTFNSDGYKPACSINDVRIYDHCLSPKEVKEISKGLVLHYKLDSNYGNNIIYDCSGYENNGSIIGTLTLSNNSPRYNNCIYFNGQSSINIGKQIYNITDAISVCFWCKGNNIPRALSCTESGGWNFEYSSGKYNFAIYTTENKYSASTLSTTVNDNIWHFVVGTFDGINKKIYTDGLLSSSITLSQKYLIKYNTNVNLYIGQESPGGNMATGYMSDVRIYATAISEDDILKLYNNSAHIDDNNNLYGFEFEEYIITNPKILKNGIVKIDNFVEPIGYIYLPAGTYINTGINYANGDECKCETTIRYESGGSGRDLMGYSDSGTGYWGVTSAGTWEAHGTFTYSNSDITQINNIIFIHSSDIENGEYKIGSLLGSYSVRGKYIYKVRLYKNGTLMRDFYPIKIDNKIGLYDLITNEYYLANNENGDIFYNKSDIKMYKYLISSNELIEK